MVNAGDVLTYTAQSSLGSYSQPNQVVSAVIAALQGTGITIESATYSTPSALSQVGDFLLDPLSTGVFTVTMQVQVSSAYNLATDVQSIIDNAFYQAVSALPVSSVPVDNSQPTGAVASAPAGGVTLPSSASSIGDAISSFFGGLGTGGTVATIAVVIVVIVILLVLVAPGRAGEAVHDIL